MKRPQWVYACAKRLHKNTGEPMKEALITANDLADEQRDMNGQSGVAWEDPVQAADAHTYEIED